MPMNESKFLGALLPSHPDYKPIIQMVREKYNLPELIPDDDPISEIFLGDEIVSLDEFRQDIRNQILENLEQIVPENFFKQYLSAKKGLEADFQMELLKFTDEQKPAIEVIFEYIKKNMQVSYQILDAQIDNMANIVYFNLLTGETLPTPDDWFGKVMTTTISGEPTIIAIASELTNLDLMFQEIRDLHKKSFGNRHVNLTDDVVGSAYYLQLRRNHKPWNFIVEQYIKRNKFKLPSRTSDNYSQVWNKYAQRLKKRLQRTKVIIDVMVRDKK